MAFVQCCYPGCKTMVGEGLKLFAFASRSCEPERFQLWIDAMGLRLGDIQNNDNFEFKKVCELHFDSSQYGLTLDKNAVPAQYDGTTQFYDETVLSERNEKLRQYNAVRKSKNEYPCNWCGRVYKTLAKKDEHEKRIHLKQEHKADAYKCKICGKGFKFRSTKNSHQITAHTEEIACKTCGKKVNARRMKNHLFTHLNAKPLKSNQCNFCQRLFKDNAQRRAHEISKHAKEIILLHEKEELTKQQREESGIRIEDSKTFNLGLENRSEGSFSVKLEPEIKVERDGT